MSFTKLPTELRHAIFLEISDPASLWALIRTSSTCYKTYSVRRREILLAVLLRSIDRDSLPYAFEIARLVRDYEEDDSSWLLPSWPSCLRDTPLALQRANELTFKELAAVACLHDKVLIIIQNFGQSALDVATSAFQTTEATHALLSCSEMRRFQRAAYFFELTSTIMRGRREALFKSGLGTSFQGSYLDMRLNDLFLPPWEFGETVCLVYYLDAQLAELVQDVGSDVRFDLSQINTELAILSYDDSTEVNDYFSRNGLMHMYIHTRGLAFWSRLLRCHSHGDRQALLQENMHLSDERHEFDKNYYREPFWQRQESEDDGIDPNDPQHQFVNDQQGPNAAWAWATREQFLPGPDEQWESLFTWGYCMWDESRLSAWGVLEKSPADLGPMKPLSWHARNYRTRL